MKWRLHIEPCQASNISTPTLTGAAHYDDDYIAVVREDGTVVCDNADFYAEPVCLEDARLIAAGPEMLAKLKKIEQWLDRIASAAEMRAKDTRFITLAEANAADAKNYRATQRDVAAVIAKAEGRT